jgi:hypothetical protein
MNDYAPKTPKRRWLRLLVDLFLVVSGCVALQFTPLAHVGAPLYPWEVWVSTLVVGATLVAVGIAYALGLNLPRP